MSPTPDPRHAVRRVQLPSGKTIEIVYFDETRDPAAAPGADLHVCPACGSQFVHPTTWEEATAIEGWLLTLRCPECEWENEAVFEQDVVEELDEQLDRGTQVLVRDLKQLERANMEEEVERFVTALDAGHIFPIDF
jgi:hypothetical protein